MHYKFKIFRSKFHEKEGFEIILKFCEHVMYAVLRKISMAIININQNFGIKKARWLMKNVQVNNGSHFLYALVSYFNYRVFKG